MTHPDTFHCEQAICIAPSRELAMQILSVVQRMGEYTPVECFFAGKDSWTRGMPKLTQQVIIGTPGTMIDVRYTAALLSRRARTLIGRVLPADGDQGTHS